MTGSFLAKLPTLRKLELLSLNECFLGQAAWKAIAACDGLKRLELAQNLLTPESLNTIGMLAKLEYLNLSECGLTDAMLKPLAKLRHLKTLIVAGNPELSPPATAGLTTSDK